MRHASMRVLGTQCATVLAAECAGCHRVQGCVIARQKGEELATQMLNDHVFPVYVLRGGVVEYFGDAVHCPGFVLRGHCLARVRSEHDRQR